MNQARIVDINRYYQHGGADWAKIRDQQDAVGICAGVGAMMDRLLPEHVEGAVKAGIPYFTYHIPGPLNVVGKTPIAQAILYLSWPGVADAPVCGDLEPVSRQFPLISAGDFGSYMVALRARSKFRPWWYSNLAYTAAHSYPRYLTEYPLWAAQYPYEPWKFREFLEYEPFLKRYPGTMPAWVSKSIYKNNCILWQFTSKGLAQKYSATAQSVKQADLNVTVVDSNRFMALISTDTTHC